MPSRVLPAAALVGWMVLGATGCSLLPDYSLRYQQAQSVPPLALPAGARPVQPLYDIPPVGTPARQLQLTTRKGRQDVFTVPEPLPLQVSAETATAAAQVPAMATVRPQLIQDGNGLPLLQVQGDSNRAWDDLGAALQSVGIAVDDRNQSLGLYYIQLSAEATKKATAFQLKLTRVADSNVLSLQKDDDNVADAAVSRQLFDRLIRHWPQAGRPSEPGVRPPQRP